MDHGPSLLFHCWYYAVCSSWTIILFDLWATGPVQSIVPHALCVIIVPPSLCQPSSMTLVTVSTHHLILPLPFSCSDSSFACASNSFSFCVVIVASLNLLLHYSEFLFMLLMFIILFWLWFFRLVTVCCHSSLFLQEIAFCCLS